MKKNKKKNKVDIFHKKGKYQCSLIVVEQEKWDSETKIYYIEEFFCTFGWMLLLQLNFICMGFLVI